MALSRVRSAAIFGIDAHLIDVEVDMYPSGSAREFVTVGMPDTAVRESRERIKSALRYPTFVVIAIVAAVFIINLFVSMYKGEKVKNDNPWDATTLEWDTPTPPPHGNFDKVPVVYRGPYEYSVPGAEKDFSPQWEAVTDSEKAAAAADLKAGHVIH